MANIPIWPGSSSFAAVSASYYNVPSTGSSPTSFGFYDNDADFKTDADKVAKFCALRLGYPLENVELQDLNFWTAFEEATTVYGNELYAYKQREDYLSLEGSPNSYSNIIDIDFSSSLITPNMGPIVRLSEQYGTEAGVGGNVNWYSGSVIVTGSQQDYDLGVWATENNLTGSDIEIKKIFFEPLPASYQFYGGLGYTGTAIAMFGASAGLTAYGGNSFLMMPLSFDLQAIQQVEMYRDILFSQYTFQLINNQLRIFPIPDSGDTGGRIWFQYLLKSERMSDSISRGSDSIVNISQMPYRNIPYASVNSVGRSWVFEYTLALAKEMLGYVRGKYTSVPIPGASVTLNQNDLISAATNEKTALISRLREYLDQTSRQSLLERRAAESVARQSELGEVPMTIFIG